MSDNETRQKLIDSAKKEFFENGFAKASLRKDLHKRRCHDRRFVLLFQKQERFVQCDCRTSAFKAEGNAD